MISIAGKTSCQKDQWSDQPTPSINSGAAAPIEGKDSVRRKATSVSLTSARELTFCHKSEKISLGRIDGIQASRVFLTTGDRRIKSHRFDAEHSGDVIVLLTALAGVNQAAHVRMHEIGRSSLTKATKRYVRAILTLAKCRASADMTATPLALSSESGLRGTES